MDDFSGNGLSCRRGDRLVFTGVDFSLPAGGALLLRGPNGSGKSSLLRIMAGLLPAVAGTLTRGGEPVAAEPDAHRADLCYVGHLDAVKPTLTVLENLCFWAGLHDEDSGERVRAALHRFGIAHLAGAPGRWLSAGQKRRLALARLLAAETGLWLLDEPTVALDVAAIAELEKVLAEHRAEGGMVVLSTHAEIDVPGAAVLAMDAFAPPGAPARREAA